MYRPYFGRKKLSQNKLKFTPRLTYTSPKEKKRCSSKKISVQNRSDLAIQSRHGDENATNRSEKK